MNMLNISLSSSYLNIFQHMLFFKLTWLVGFLVGWNHSILLNKTLTSFNFYFYQILTAFHMLNIVSEAAHDNWKKLQLLTGLIHYNWKEEATVLNVYIRENVSKLWNVYLIQLYIKQYNSKLWPVLAGSSQISDEGNIFCLYWVLQGGKMKECIRRDCFFKLYVLVNFSFAILYTCTMHDTSIIFTPVFNTVSVQAL